MDLLSPDVAVGCNVSQDDTADTLMQWELETELPMLSPSHSLGSGRSKFRPGARNRMTVTWVA